MVSDIYKIPYNICLSLCISSLIPIEFHFVKLWRQGEKKSLHNGKKVFYLTNENHKASVHLENFKCKWIELKP